MAEIEAQNPSPWSMSALRRELLVPGGLQLVVESGQNRPIAWCACRLIPPEAELLKIAVAAGDRRLGLAGILLERLVEMLAEEGIGWLYLEVRANNQPARSLYAKYGFVLAGMRRGYYAEPPDAAVVLKKELTRQGCGQLVKPINE